MADLYWIGATSGSWSTGSNWSTASAPTTGDNVVIDGRSTRAIDSGLAQGAVTLATLRIDLSNIYDVGLAASPLVIGATKVEIGRSETSGIGASGASLIHLDFSSIANTTYVYGTNTSGASGLEPFVYKGTHAANVLHLYDGVVGIATADPGHVATVVTINVHGGRLRIPDGCTLATINQTDGELEVESALTTLTMTESGTATTRGTGAITTVKVGGSCIFNSLSTGTITNLHTYESGVADFSGSAAARTVTNATKHSNTSRINARTGAALAITFTNGIDCDNCSNVNIDFGDHVTVTPSSI
jgi:hypothetical protein